MSSVDELQLSLTAARACLEDLQAEIEAGSRYVERIHADAHTIDRRVLTYQRGCERLEALRRCAADLKASILEQRGLLRDLRRSIDEMRLALRQRK
jgi:hypothetical protein